ncbi:hypothetical protein PILCRDRAFT_81352 [Piloderma croceum F 1598]|uniref:Uncharacterized protein n=1 Tax=Piloderma croceum (strain F 1598) TaxID=765440 RepID=A0A0C3EKS8_PILCF|nr:hypothetical protein PILCRDRAFT_81345 [Piloderma croceum F 1598]KIM73209.1 hypothetical protein PILCRDRAFT_81352 [Piloderma croceum F 1598]
MVSSSKSMRSIFSRTWCMAASEQRRAISEPDVTIRSFFTCSGSTSSANFVFFV